MNSTFITVNNAFTALVSNRPVSHAAAATLLCTSLYAVHDGMASVLPAGLAAAGTAAMAAAEWLQWTALGRMSKLDAARGEESRMLALKGQCLGIGIFQVAGYTLSIVSQAASGHQNWSSGWALAAVIGFACIFAAFNFFAKWTSCDKVEGTTGPTGGQRVHDALFSSRPALPAPGFEPAETARYTSDEGVVDFQDALRRRGELNFEDQDHRILNSATRDGPERYKLWKKRENMRQRRAA